MATVYAAWDPIISRKVAIKTVRLPDAADIDAQEKLARFKREAQAAGGSRIPTSSASSITARRTSWRISSWSSSTGTR